MFQSLRGVIDVAQGFVRSDPPHENWSEAVRLSFDPDQINLMDLIEIHLRTHASMSDHSMRKKYRSAIYTVDCEQRVVVLQALHSLQKSFNKPLITLALPFRGFRLSEERFQSYYVKSPERPFCRAHIEPKLALLRERYSKQIR